MSLNAQPSASRVHIGFFGRRNAGKSSLVNAVTGQALSIVSPVPGTTTDPVQKAMELLPLGPVVIMDTPGLDDRGELGGLRVARAQRMLHKADVAVLVVDAAQGLSPDDSALLEAIRERQLPYVVALNKAELLAERQEAPADSLYVSAETGEGILALKQRIAQLAQPKQPPRRLVGDLLSPHDLVVLVTPMDEAAPKGRLILPQQQTIRDCLDVGAIPLLARPEELPQALSALSQPPRLVITDSQAFGAVNAMLPPDVPLTSFSILFARFKGSLLQAVQGAARLDRLQAGDRVLVSEGCSHHRQCRDIGTVKLPAWIKRHAGPGIRFDFTQGGDFPEDLAPYALALHCGGCMLNDREMLYRSQQARQAGLPMTNYGTAIAHMNGILKRSLAPFPEAAGLLDG